MPDEIDWNIHEQWGARVADAFARYSRDHTNEHARVEYLRLLRTFAQLVMHGKVPDHL